MFFILYYLIFQSLFLFILRFKLSLEMFRVNILLYVFLILEWGRFESDFVIFPSLLLSYASVLTPSKAYFRATNRLKFEIFHGFTPGPATLVTFQMVLSVILLSMLMILLSIYSKCGQALVRSTPQNRRKRWKSRKWRKNS